MTLYCHVNGIVLCKTIMLFIVAAKFASSSTVRSLHGSLVLNLTPNNNKS